MHTNITWIHTAFTENKCPTYATEPPSPKQQQQINSHCTVYLQVAKHNDHKEKEKRKKEVSSLLTPLPTAISLKNKNKINSPWYAAFEVPLTMNLNSRSLSGSWTLMRMYLNFPLLSISTSFIATSFGFLKDVADDICWDAMAKRLWAARRTDLQKQLMKHWGSR